MGAVLYSFARDWVLGPHLRGTCARAATQKLDFADLGLRSSRVDCAQAFFYAECLLFTQQPTLPAEVASSSSRPAAYS